MRGKAREVFNVFCVLCVLYALLYAFSYALVRYPL